MSAPSLDWSGGRWRAPLPRDEWPAAQPQHERWKTFVPEEQTVIRFAGLGRYGDAARRRAERLADLRLGPPPGRLKDGFLEMPFVDGTPAIDGVTAADAATIGACIGRVTAAFSCDEAADTIALSRMIVHNLGDVVSVESIDAPRDVVASHLDGRMLAHEWIRSADGLVKVDALDHGAHHFLPGPQSPAWDLAAAELEFGMNARERAALLDGFERASPDRRAAALLPFYRLAYAAFRYGYATLAAETLAGTEDARRFAAAARRYSQCALNAAACFTASSKSPRKQIARSSMKT